jgi:hypothetical protein
MFFKDIILVDLIFLFALTEVIMDPAPDITLKILAAPGYGYSIFIVEKS